MEVSEIIDGILNKKKEQDLSTQTISDASGVPKSTVDRILRKETANPSMQNVLDIAAAVGYRIGGEIPKPDFPRDEKFVEYIMLLNDDRVSRMKAHHNQMLAEKDRRIETQEKWIRGLVVAIILLVVFIITWLVVDVLHPTAGWIQRAIAAGMIDANGTDFVTRISNFFSGIWH